jgi:hypothetical protein
MLYQVSELQPVVPAVDHHPVMNVGVAAKSDPSSVEGMMLMVLQDEQVSRNRWRCTLGLDIRNWHRYWHFLRPTSPFHATQAVRGPTPTRPFSSEVTIQIGFKSWERVPPKFSLPP